MPEIPQFILERARANAGIFTSDEVAEWPAGLLDQLVASGVLRADQPAKTVRCDSCGDDHAEVVQYMESPPGTELRAYIPCPQLGRVFIPTVRLRCWSVNMGMLPIKAARSKPVDHRATRRKTVATKSWTQPDLDAAIREYKAKRASTYRDLLEGVKAGRPGARKAAQEMFGRNAVARQLGVKAPAMVSKSPDWQQLADELAISRGMDRNTPKHRKIGLDIAMESSATDSRPALELAVRQETIRLVEKSMSQTEAAAVLEKLELGDISDDQARALIEVVRDQKREGRTRRIRGNS